MDVLLYCCRHCPDVLKKYGLERWCTDASPDASRGPCQVSTSHVVPVVAVYIGLVWFSLPPSTHVLEKRISHA